MSLFDLVVLGLAAHRLWMIWFFSKFTWSLREWMKRKGGWWEYLAGCQLCVSVWCGFGATALWYTGPYGQALNLGLAAGGLVFFVQPFVSLMESRVQRNQAEVSRIQAEVKSWSRPQ